MKSRFKLMPGWSRLLSIAAIAMGRWQEGSSAGRFAQRVPGERRDITERLIARQGTDIERWSKAENLMTSWEVRAKVASRFVPPGARLLDIGCGAMNLERFLDPSVTYLPADIVKRDERTLLCDLNAGKLPETQADVISLLGIVEYIHDVPALFAALRRTGRSLILSYNPVDLGETDCDRRAQGWFNDFSSAELCALATEAGFRLVDMVTIHPERLYELRPA